jgi:hypothetical protein
MRLRNSSANRLVMVSSETDKNWEGYGRYMKNDQNCPFLEKNGTRPKFRK